MFKGLPFFGTPLSPGIVRINLKLTLGGALLLFFFGYQPIFSFQPVRKAVVYAQNEQSQQIKAAALPIVFQTPHPGYISTYFSSFHPGIDLATGLGMPIRPIAKGVVTNTGFDLWGLGLTVEVDHGYGYSSLYAHMGKIYVRRGQAVSERDLLGEVGLTGRTTGPHTHLEVSKDGVKIDPVQILPAMRQFPTAADFKKAGLAPRAEAQDFRGGRNNLPVIGEGQTEPNAPQTESIPSPLKPEERLDLQKVLSQKSAPKINLLSY